MAFFRFAGGTRESYFKLLLESGHSASDAEAIIASDEAYSEDYYMGADMAKIQFASSNTQETYPRGWTICVDLSVQSAPRILLTYMIIVSPNYPLKEKIIAFDKKLDNPVALSEILNTLQEIDPSLPVDYIKLENTLVYVYK